MNKKILFIITGIVVGLLLVLLSLFVYFRSTPQYSLIQIKKASQERDYALFEKYVDVNSIVDNVFAELMQDTDQKEGDLFAGILSGMTNTMKDTTKTAFKTAVENGEYEDSLYSEMNIINLLTKLKIEKHGKTADVKFEIDEKVLDITMRNENGIWRIFKINNFDSIADTEKKAPANTFEKALNEEIILSTLSLKVNKVEKVSALEVSWGDPVKPSSIDNTFLKINITVKNISEEEMNVSSNMIVLSDDQNNQYEMEYLFIEDKNQLYYESINPGLVKTGNIYFEVPKSAKGFVIPISHKDTGDLYKISLGL